MRAVRYVGRIFRSAKSGGPIVLVRRSLGEGGRSAVPAQRLLSALLVALACAAPASAQEVIEYYATDHLGSIRVVFDAAGNVIARADYLPFGEELFAPTGPLPAERFTGQARDGEAGLDYFHARQYQPRTGRFSAVDQIFNAFVNPQKWNRYSYAINRPTELTDRDGLDPSRADLEWMLGGLATGPTVGRAYGEGGNGGGGFRSEFSLASEQQWSDDLLKGFWTDQLNRYNPTGSRYTDEGAAADAITPSMRLATAHTSWEWGRNFYNDGDGVTIGRPLTSGSDRFIEWRLREDDATLRRGSAWTGVFHTHPADLDGLDRRVSDEDKWLARKYGKISYVLPASGGLLRIDSVTGNVIDVRTGRVVP